MSARRTYGTGSLMTKVDRNGDEVWFGRWWIDGRRVKRRLGFKRSATQPHGLTAKQAEHALRETMQSVGADELAGLARTNRARKAPSIGQVLDAYLADQGANLKQRTTAHDYRRTGANWLVPFFGDRPVDDITADDVRAFRDLMATRRLRNHGQESGAGLAPKSIRNNLTLLSTLLNYAARRGWVARNVATDVPRPGDRRDDEPLRFLEVHQVFDLVAHARPGASHAVDAALYLTAALTGLRMGELRALRWECVDWAAGAIRVDRSLSRGEESSPKSRKRRSVPMAPAVAQRLDGLREASRWDGDQDLVFAQPVSGGPLPYTAAMKRYRASLSAAGLPEGFRFHDLRHTFGTTLARAGEPVTAICEWMGHSSVKVTERYMHFAPRHDQAARIAAAFTVADPRLEIGPLGPNPTSPSVTQANATAS